MMMSHVMVVYGLLFHKLILVCYCVMWSVYQKVWMQRMCQRECMCRLYVSRCSLRKFTGGYIHKTPSSWQYLLYCTKKSESSLGLINGILTEIALSELAWIKSTWIKISEFLHPNFQLQKQICQALLKILLPWGFSLSLIDVPCHNALLSARSDNTLI